MSQPTVVITGANGFIGSALIKHFAAKGWQVRALVYDAANQPAIKNTAYYQYDLSTAPDDSMLAGADYVLHAAFVKADKKHPNAFELNTQGTKLLLEKCRQHHVKKTVFMSSVSAHEEALSVYGKQKFALEKLFTKKSEAVIRSSLVIGDGGLFKSLVTFMRSKHLAPVIDGGDQPLQVIALYDLVRVIETIFVKDVHGILTIGTPEVYSYREFYDTLRRKLHIKAWIIPLPFILPLLLIRTITFLRLPLQVNEDNLLGLKKMKAFETLPDLEKLGIELDPLETILGKIKVTQ